MKWITELSIENYRAFTKKETMKIPFKHHLLIYGENGSGKSSIYNALKDFFTSSDRPAETITLNHFEQQKGNNTGSIEVEITDSSNPPNITNYKFAEPNADSTHRNIQELLLANKVKGFLDYKGLLKTYFIEAADGQNPNLFDLLVENLLADYKINRISGYGSAEDELSKQWEAIKTPLQKKNYDGRRSVCRTAKAYLPEFERELNSLLTRVFVEFKRFITEYFDTKLEISATVSKINFNNKTWEIDRGIYLDIKYADLQVSSYQHFLNEARLSALASCLYLASISKFPIDTTFEIRPLFLDDVFIGLDTNNRIPLLKLLYEEFIKKDYQIFISTYDRQWFELARNWFANKDIPFKCLEMFVGSDDNPTNPDNPVLLRYKDNFSRAQEYFEAKDYPAAGNYLRKECESIILNLLPETYQIDVNGSKIQELESLFQQLEKLYKDSNQPFPQELMNSLKIYRRLILNPSSHNDNECPLFRKEIEEAIALVKELRNTPKIVRNKILDKNDVLRIKFPEQNYEMEINPSDNVFSCELNENKILSQDPLKFYIKKWTLDGTEFGIKQNGNVIRLAQDYIDTSLDDKRELQEIFKGIHRSIGITLPEDLEASVITGSAITLRDLIS